MESKNYSSPEPETLNAVDSSEVIEKRIKRIKELFLKLFITTIIQVALIPRIIMRWIVLSKL